MAALIVLGLVTPREGISGFANEATITVALMLVLSAGLLRTGTIDLLGRRMGRMAGGKERRLLLIVVAMSIPISAVLNNTAVVAILMPVVLGLSRTHAVAPSRILMPLSFASQIGGTITLVGTSTNLIVAGLVLDLGLDRIGLFDITPAALILAVVGVAYLLTLGAWLTPTRNSSSDLLQRYELGDYLAGLTLDPDSNLAGRSLAELRFAEEYGLEVLAIDRADGRVTALSGGTVLAPGDALLVRGTIAEIAHVEEIPGLRVSGSTPPLMEGLGEGGDAASSGDGDSLLAEVLVPPRSHVIGRSLRDLGFRARFGVGVLGLQRHGRAVQERIADLALEAGDVLLVQGPSSALQQVHQERDLALLGAVDVPARRKRKMKIAVPVMAGVVLLPAFGVTTILVSALLGAIAMFLTGCITPEEAYEEMDWSVIMLLGTLLPLGIAMQRSGTAEMLADGLVGATAPLGAYGTLAAFYLLTTALTSLISNAAAAVVLTPMAVATGAALGVSPIPFVITVMFAASNSFLTPIGYQTNLFVYAPGGYRFSDFVRVGGPLTLLLAAASTFIIPIFFPFNAR
jgi:di/tricarboxylate transporter